MPGLLRGVARTAVIAGTATAVSNRVSRRQARRWGGQEVYEEAPPQEQLPPEPPPEEDPIERLRKLASLRDDGILTDEEFEAEKRKVLNG